MKRVLIVLAVFACVVVIFMSGFIAGSVRQLGYFVHLSKNVTAPAQSNSENTNYTAPSTESRAPQNYGVIVPIGQFTSNLAGTGRHVLDCSISLELTGKNGTVELVQSPVWMNRIRSEIFMLIKNRVYDDLTNAEGALQFAGDIKHSLNRMLPDVPAACCTIWRSSSRSKCAV